MQHARQEPKVTELNHEQTSSDESLQRMASHSSEKDFNQQVEEFTDNSAERSGRENELVQSHGISEKTRANRADSRISELQQLSSVKRQDIGGD